MTDEGERCRRELGKHKGSTQITEEQLLEEPKLSLPSAHGSQTFFHGPLTAPLSLLTLCLHLNACSICRGDGCDGCDVLMGWVVFTSHLFPLFSQMASGQIQGRRKRLGLQYLLYSSDPLHFQMSSHKSSGTSPTTCRAASTPPFGASESYLSP